MGNYLITDIIQDFNNLYKKCEDETYLIRYDELKRIGYEMGFLYILKYPDADEHYNHMVDEIMTHTVLSRRKNFKIIFEDIVNETKKILEEK